MSDAAGTPRAVCARCRRPERVCWCKQLARLESPTRTVFLQHPREGRVAIGTARMAHLSLPNSELHQGVTFADHARVRELAAAEGTALLFPGPGALTPESFVGRAPRTLLVVDGTWAQAKKVVKVNPFLHALPRLGFVPRRPSNYRIRAEPAEDCVSTIEAVVHVLGALEGDADRYLPLLAAFERMVDLQLEHARLRTEPRRRPKAPRPLADETTLLLRARAGDVVALSAEANAHGAGSQVQGAPELLQLVALRPSTGARFEALLAPRRPLAPRAPSHLELPAERLLSGEPVAPALERFAAFLREGDVFCGWGGYALDLLAHEGGPSRPFVDLRAAAQRRLRQRPSGVEAALRLLGHAEPPALGEGRAWRRVTALAALADALARTPGDSGPASE